MTTTNIYIDYLNSTEWQIKRVACFELYGKHCHLCGSVKKLHVHHKTYKRLTCEDVKTDLVPLCEKHHSALHKFCKEHNLDVWTGSNQYIEYYLKPAKKKTRPIRLREKHQKRKIKWKQPKKKKVVKNSEKDLQNFKDLLKAVEAERNLPPEEMYRQMRERVAKRREERQKPTPPKPKHINNKTMRRLKREARLAKTPYPQVTIAKHKQ